MSIYQVTLMNKESYPPSPSPPLSLSLFHLCVCFCCFRRVLADCCHHLRRWVAWLCGEYCRQVWVLLCSGYHCLHRRHCCWCSANRWQKGRWNVSCINQSECPIHNTKEMPLHKPVAPPNTLQWRNEPSPSLPPSLHVNYLHYGIHQLSLICQPDIWGD